MEPLPPCNDVENALNLYGSMLWRLGLSMMRNPADAEDALQETMLKYLRKSPVFAGPEHEKAWLIRVHTNICRDMLRKKKRRSDAPENSHPEASVSGETGVMEALGQMPEKFRLAMMLHYAEGYSVNEIASIIHRTPSAVKMRLKKGRGLLEEILRTERLL